MNINIYLEDELGKNISKTAEQQGKTRNAVIREALKLWLDKQKKKAWPKSVLNFKGVKDFPRFEDTRTELSEPKDDLFE